MNRGRGEPLTPGTLVRVAGDYETFQGDHFRTAPAFIRLDWLRFEGSEDENPFLSDQIHIPIGSTMLIVGCRRVKEDDWGIIALFDGLLLSSFYTYTPFTMHEVFETLAEFDQCVG